MVWIGIDTWHKFLSRPQRSSDEMEGDVSRRGLLAQMLRSTEQGHHRVIKSSGRGVLSEAGVNFDAKIIQETSSANPPPCLHIEHPAAVLVPESDMYLLQTA